MNEASRTKRTMQNSKTSLLLFLAQVFVGFLTRKIFLDYLGAEVLGLNTTLGNILGFLNLAELGIGIAMATALYKPIHENNQETICEIVSMQGLLYRRIALFLCGTSVIVMLLLPFLFPNTECGLLYVYVAFSVFLSGSITSYLWNYREVLISADQKNFKLLPWLHALRYLKMGLQIFFLVVVHWGIWGWIWWELVHNIIAVFVVNAVLKKEYPWLHSSALKGKDLLRKYPHLLIKTRQIFVHKIAGFVLEQTPPLFISAFVSLSMVTYYGNYILLVSYMSSLLGAIFSGMGASIGSLIAENDRRHTLEVFWELFTSRLWIVGVACYGLFIFMTPFLSAWIGEKYVLPNTTFLLILIGAFIRLSRTIVDSFKDACQLFGDIWAPVVEAAINFSGSLLFGYWWGLDGILIGSNLSLLLIVVIWKPYYLFKRGLKSSYWNYYQQYIYHVVVLLGCSWVAFQLACLSLATNNYVIQMLWLVPSFLVFVILSYALFMCTTSGMRRFTLRILNLVLHKI